MNSKIFKTLLVLLIGITIIFGVVYMMGSNTLNLEDVPNDNSPEITEPEEQFESPEAEVLIDTPWVWVRTESAAGEDVIAPEGDRFTLTFHEDGTLTPTTDCNGVFGTYVRNGEALIFGAFGQTQMYCEDSLESVYVESLSHTYSYSQSRNELHLFLSQDFGKMIFVKKN